MKSKKLILFLIILFPSLFWLVLEMSTINSRKLPYFGPKQAVKKGDTLYYTVGDRFYKPTASGALEEIALDTTRFPLFVLLVMNEKYKAEGYRIHGLEEYVRFNPSKIKEMPVVIAGSCTEADSTHAANCIDYSYLFDLKTNKNLHLLHWPAALADSLGKSYFKEKPAHIDYSFLVLVDKYRHIRGYYDGRYADEIKRLTEEYKHLRLKEEKNLLINANKVESK